VGSQLQLLQGEVSARTIGHEDGGIEVIISDKLFQNLAFV
jgi:hypothetical protein